MNDDNAEMLGVMDTFVRCDVPVLRTGHLHFVDGAGYIGRGSGSGIVKKMLQP